MRLRPTHDGPDRNASLLPSLKNLEQLLAAGRVDALIGPADEAERFATNPAPAPPDRSARLPRRSRMLLPGAGAATVPIHVLERLCENRKAPLLFVLPFTAAHGRQMRAFTEAMGRRGFHAVAIDLPGHGRSGGDRGVVRLEEIHENLGAVIEHYAQRFPDSRAGLVGSSWGGDLAILHALWEEGQHRGRRRPRRVAAVLGQSVITPWQRRAVVHFRPGLSLLFDPSGAGKDLIRLALGPRIPIARMFRVADLYDSVPRRRRFTIDPLRLRSYETASYLNYLTFRPEVAPASLTIPILLVAGARDRLVPPHYQRRVYESLRSEHPATAFSVVGNASHAMFEEQTPAAARLAAQWFSETLPKPCVSPNRAGP